MNKSRGSHQFAEKSVINPESETSMKVQSPHNVLSRSQRTLFSAHTWLLLCGLLCTASGLRAQTLKFPLASSGPALRQPVRTQAFFDVIGRKAAFLSRESGESEFWIFPFQILRRLTLQFRLEGMAAPSPLQPYASEIEILPERTTIIYSHPLFTAKAHFFVPPDQPAGIILLEIDSAKDLQITVSMLPSLQPMWPAGMGGQYAYWDEQRTAYVISESRRRYNAVAGTPNARRQSPPLAHALAEKPILFTIEHSRELSGDSFYPIVFTADFTDRQAALQRYANLLESIEKLYADTRQYYRELFATRLQLKGTEFDEALRWNQLALHQGFIDNPDLGSGLVAGFGPSGASRRPGFSWFFGGDMFLNAPALLLSGEHEIVRRSIAFLQKWQRSDGKMMHELSQSAGLIDWFGEYPYGYIHGDTTPLYLIAMHEYFRSSGDSLFIRESWPSLERAYFWCRRTDSDGDGLMENTLAGLGASEVGSLREKSGVDIFLASAGVQAWWAFSTLAEITGNDSLRLQSLRWFETGRSSLEKKFWNDSTGYYNFSLTRDGRPNAELSAWMAFPMRYDLLDPEHSQRAVTALASAQISTDWGSRMLSAGSAAYDPIAYNNGAVWPFLTGFTTLAFYRHELAETGLQSLRNLANWLRYDALGTMPEIASGAYFRALESSVPHQLFSSSAFISGLLHGLLGLEVDAAARRVRFMPSLPPTWDAFQIQNIAVGSDTLALLVNQSFDSFELAVLRAPEHPVTLEIAPAFGPYARLLSIEGDAGEAEARLSMGTTRFFTTMQAKTGATLRMSIDDPVRVWLPYSSPRPGDAPQQLRLCRIEHDAEGRYSLLIEGPGGSTGTLHYYARNALSVDGAELRDDGSMVITFEGEGYIRKWLRIQVPIEKE